MLLTQTHFPLSGKENNAEILAVFSAVALLLLVYNANLNTAQVVHIKSKVTK
jgi:uncharacterized membrane protein